MKSLLLFRSIDWEIQKTHALLHVYLGAVMTFFGVVDRYTF